MDGLLNRASRVYRPQWEGASSSFAVLEGHLTGLSMNNS